MSRKMYRIYKKIIMSYIHNTFDLGTQKSMQFMYICIYIMYIHGYTYLCTICLYISWNTNSIIILQVRNQFSFVQIFSSKVENIIIFIYYIYNYIYWAANVVDRKKATLVRTWNLFFYSFHLYLAIWLSFTNGTLVNVIQAVS
jgi:hypothetical protein